MYPMSVHDGFIPRQKWFVEEIIQPLSGLTLDCGCARGLWSKELKQRGLDVVGLDLSRRRLKMSRREGNNTDVICGSATSLPFRQNCFDSVLFLEIVEHMDQTGQNESLKEIEHVLKPGGNVVVTTPNKRIYHLLTKYLHLFEYNPEHLRELTLNETKKLLRKYFEIDLVDGKTGSDILDKLVPVSLCWDLLLVGKKSQLTS
jgi:2-polyprenyl-3-methyl-5-hydroxy-6-metoxy-1,4-benzoquinol methylase